MKIVEEARQNQGKALLGHLNRSINLLIKAAPDHWTGPLDAITMVNGGWREMSGNLPSQGAPHLAATVSMPPNVSPATAPWKSLP